MVKKYKTLTPVSADEARDLVRENDKKCAGINDRKIGFMTGRLHYPSRSNGIYFLVSEDKRVPLRFENLNHLHVEVPAEGLVRLAEKINGYFTPQ